MIIISFIFLLHQKYQIEYIQFYYMTLRIFTISKVNIELII